MTFQALNWIRWWAKGFLLATSTAQAIIYYTTGDPNYNRLPPTGELAGSGWQFQGEWGGFLGTPIAPQYFMTASHFGGSIGEAFVYQGISYTTTAFFDDPATDLRIWRICGTFPTYTACYSNRDEVGKDLVIFGRGTQRGGEVIVAHQGTNQLKGWLWGASDGALRWGENQVAEVVNGDDPPAVTGVGELLAAKFEAGSGANECTLSGGDSGGGAFLRDGESWKLGGINYAVDSPFSLTLDGPVFYAAIFDLGGLYSVDKTDHVLTEPRPEAQPSSCYFTRISSAMEWINQILALPVSASAAPTLQAAMAVEGPYTDVTEVTVDAAAQSISAALSGVDRYYRLRSCEPLRISSIEVRNQRLSLSYAAATRLPASLRSRPSDR